MRLKNWGFVYLLVNSNSSVLDWFAFSPQHWHHFEGNSSADPGTSERSFGFLPVTLTAASSANAIVFAARFIHSMIQCNDIYIPQLEWKAISLWSTQYYSLRNIRGPWRKLYTPVSQEISTVEITAWCILIWHIASMVDSGLTFSMAPNISRKTTIGFD